MLREVYSRFIKIMYTDHTDRLLDLLLTHNNSSYSKSDIIKKYTMTIFCICSIILQCGMRFENKVALGNWGGGGGDMKRLKCKLVSWIWLDEAFVENKNRNAMVPPLIV